jgi:folate-binding protein YgfZ
VCDADVGNAARIEAGMPISGVETSDKTLPQELDRIEQTINFRKGCYLGQETVARLDALGHVNRTLVGVQFASADRANVPPTATELTVDGAAVGQITSAVWSPKFGATVALAYVRTGSNKPGTKLDSAFGAAQVVPLPMV